MAASYPASLKMFTTYVDRPGPDSLTLDVAHISNEVHDEIIAIEKIIGPSPFVVPGYIAANSGISMSIKWLYSNKSAGRVDSRNNINPGPPPGHTHLHATTLPPLPKGKPPPTQTDDHLQYMRVDATRAFRNPVTGQNATSASHLITLRQASTAGLNSTQVNNVIQQELDNNTLPYKPVTFPTEGKYKFTGGHFSGYTNENGVVFIDFGPAHFSRLVTFVYMKMPYPGLSQLGYYAYRYEEDQLILTGLSTAGAWIQFIEDIVVDRQALISLSWMALGA